MGDLIDRKTAIEAVKKYGKDAISTGRRTPDPVDDIVELCNMLDALPAVDAAPVVHGRWISWAEADNHIPSLNRHECSICHDAAQVLVSGFEMLSFYCPNCGAKMNGEGDAE